MKICKQALYVQVIDSVGTVRACGWAGYYVLGNLIDNNMKEVYHSEAAKRFRQTLIDGTYDFCNEENCPYMANGTLDTQLIEIEEIPEYPPIVSLAYDRRCNYQCTCCISKSNRPIDAVKKEKVENEIREALPYIKTLSGNGLGELFVSDSMLQLISEWNPNFDEDVSFDLETNGSLFTENNWNKIKNVGNYDLSVFLTVHSFEEKAYQYLSGTRSSVENIVENLKFVKKLRKQGVINFLEIATVVQERNFRTLPEFIDRCINEFGADRVRIRRFLPEKALDENIEWFFDVRNPLHPYHKEYLEVMSHPIMSHPKVFIWTGDHLSNRGGIPAKENYDILRKMVLDVEIDKKLESFLNNSGINEIVLYAKTDIAEALLKMLDNTSIRIKYMYDRNPDLASWKGLEVKNPTFINLKEEKNAILVTLIARYKEVEDNLRKFGYTGQIINLKEIFEKFDN